MPVMFSFRKPAHNSWPPLPPKKETDEQRRTRIKKDTDARRKSDSIDRQLRLEREEKERHPSGAKILLLGQAESGKSTVLKNFQLRFAPKAFELDAEMWRPVIQLNLVRSVNFIVALISNQGLYNAQPYQVGASWPHISPKILTLCLRLAPLRRIEEDFVKILSRRSSLGMQYPRSSVHLLENAVRNGTLHCCSESTTTLGKSDFDRPEHGPSRRVLAALGEDIAALWRNESIQQALKSAEIALEEHPGFFLDHAIRVTRESYKPSPKDILRARVTTFGPVAHTIVAEGFSGRGKQWTIYDVGGSRNQRATWAQFFDDVNVVIFLAPLSGFNQFLAEDENVNRLADSLRLWELICSNKLLASVELVLFLNKMDILDSKLKSGIRFSSFVTAYANRPNETKFVTQYLLNVFVSIYKNYSQKHRRLYSHFTCAIDATATANIIQQIKDITLMKMLAQNEVL